MSPTFNPDDYGPILAEWLKIAHPVNLGPGQPDESLRARFGELTADHAFAGKIIHDADMGKACLCGVLLRLDFLEDSHVISQQVETPTGSFWHGIMHRREPDYGNAKYWFRHVGTHSVIDQLKAEFPSYNPFLFIDEVAAAYSVGGVEELRCQQIQRREWELLFDFSYRGAVG
ncbi:hypothetical protein [Cerasicoccus arenae]|uniref:Uncharacterized protein n=1 Tax=Cerasicoccus arenae TaxID=424488 RepID=A0A8J3GE63_9BACT|nr:hypothetical protein [Cerasicoccus arenae]MBK1857924.1 hypothetical protein [Cerasicoccus arenae]GHC00722.1 hypothetical protein GCM10007047_16480 [Cerasicoccus arenae]